LESDDDEGNDDQEGTVVDRIEQDDEEAPIINIFEMLKSNPFLDADDAEESEESDQDDDE
jgi:hypothetical protein